MDIKNYVAYYRVSTKKQRRSGLGLESQKAIIEHFAEKDKATIVGLSRTNRGIVSHENGDIPRRL